MLGVGLAMTDWASLICLLACVFAGHFYRVRVEEQVLRGAWGSRTWITCGAQSVSSRG